MQNLQNKKLLQIGLFVLVAVVTLGIGYASITAINLLINGNATTSVNQNNFVVHFVAAENITGTTGVSGTSTYEETTAEFNVTGLTKVGDYAIAKYTVRNDSAAIGTEISLNLTSTNTEYFKVTETIDDNKLQAGDATTASVKVEMIKTPINDSVTTSVTAKLISTPIENANATGGDRNSKATDDSVSFATDSWTTIKTNVQNGNISQYNIGDTKIVSINNTNYTVRLVNKSVNANCSNANYSETACGFVVEFVDIITIMKMRDTNTNVSGYPATLVYDYLKNTLYSQLPSDLQTVIKPTRVISGDGSNDSTNFTTTDKLYLLSAEEVYGIDDGGNHFYDTVYGTSHQLEYYSNNGVTYSTNSWSGTNLNKAAKQYNSSNRWWWLRSTTSGNNPHFHLINSDGSWNNYLDNDSVGVAPAFRIG